MLPVSCLAQLSSSPPPPPYHHHRCHFFSLLVTPLLGMATIPAALSVVVSCNKIQPSSSSSPSPHRFFPSCVSFVVDRPCAPCPLGRGATYAHSRWTSVSESSGLTGSRAPRTSGRRNAASTSEKLIGCRLSTCPFPPNPIVSEVSVVDSALDDVLWVFCASS